MRWPHLAAVATLYTGLPLKTLTVPEKKQCKSVRYGEKSQRYLPNIGGAQRALVACAVATNGTEGDQPLSASALFGSLAQAAGISR